MLSPSDFHDIVSGRRKGGTAAAVRTGLRIAEFPYAMAMQLRNYRFDHGHARVSRAEVPVISVGNLTLGGTGKTPMVIWLADFLTTQGMNVAILSRGFGAKPGEANDEAQELKRRLPDVLHLQNPDRVAAARQAVRDYQVDVLILDDGFQHRRLDRDLDIVLVDATEPFGFGHVFPRGSLREPMSGIARAQAAVLTRADCIDSNAAERIRSTYRDFAPNLVWLEAIHQPIAAVNAAGETTPLMDFSNETVVGVCAIGNPRNFQKTLFDCGCHVVEFIEFPDHHQYSAHDIARIESVVSDHQATRVICTEKDIVKLPHERIGSAPLQALRVQMQLRDGSPLHQLLRPLIQPIRQGPST